MLQRCTGTLGLVTLAASSCLATAVACGPDGAPRLSGLADQVAQVGSELTLELVGSDPEGGDLVYDFHAAGLANLEGRAAITQSPSGTGIFRWTPLGADVGRHAFDFTVSDGGQTATVTITIDVRSAIGAATAPVFRRPLGSGTTLDLAHQACLELQIAVDDQDSAAVAIALGEPAIEGAELRPGERGTATWRWCPSREQQAEPRKTLVLIADDGDNPPTVKHYLIVLRGGAGTGCPGSGPSIAHMPGDAASILDLAITATISDDRGIKEAPLFYVSMAPPATLPGGAPDLSRMTQLTMRAVSGGRQSGVYAADVANPVARMPAGTRQTLYYAIAASDDDDATGSCDHTSVSPVYTMTVTASGTADLAMCAPCTSDIQCGAGDACVRMGHDGDPAASYCLQSCDGGCPAGTTCAAAPVTSVDGQAALQCVPDAGTCTRLTPACSDDVREVNDSRTAASQLVPDLYDLVSCPSAISTSRANDDWFQIAIAGDTRVDIQLAGGPASDLDLHLYSATGSLISGSTSLDPDEQVTACLSAATYYVKVNGYGSGRNEYLLSYETRPESCNTTCVDDAREHDDTYSQARPALSGVMSTGNAICPGDDDWYKVVLVTGDVLTVDLAFSQSHPSQDLDLHLYKNSIDLTPCDPSNPSSCTAEHGQSGSSNEHTRYTAPAGCELGCDYYVVVRGYDFSANRYDIAIRIQ